MDADAETKFRRANARHLTNLMTDAADESAIGALFVATQRELSGLAASLMRNERANHTLQPTALVNEAYLRLFEVRQLPIESRAHFVNLAARVMRQVLVEHARRKNADKRGGGWHAVTLTGVQVQDFRNDIGILEMDDALRKLAQVDERAADVVEKRVFGGLKMEEIAELSGVTRRTVQKDWRFATLWLRREFAQDAGQKS